uniref:Transmembrane protein 214 n=1 Tax=Cacopsylla melanoneura TaxID=428564 RepID=A0A8D9DTU2_9HEMI
MPDWEVVGKKKKEMQMTRKEKKIEEQEFINSAPTLEEILPHAQVMSLYADLNSNNTKNMPPSKAANKENGKKNQKKPQEKKKKAAPGPVNDKPRTLEAAVASLKYDELKSDYEIAKVRFDENPLQQLKALTAFFTSKLVVDQNKIVFSGKCLEHPLGLFPDKHRNFLQHVFSEVDKDTRYQFFDTCLLALVHDLKQGNPISGYKVMLQSLVSNHPEVLYDNFDLITDLIQSYSNQNKIGISTAIMWVLAQAANFNFKHGLQVWRTFMLSFIEQKNYTRYSLDYLKHLFSRSHNRQRDALSIPEYLECVDLLFEYYNIPKSCLTELQSSCKLFRERASLKDAGKYFLMVLEEKIPQPSSTLYRQEMVAFLYSLLREDPYACFQHWRDVYANNLPESVLLLRLIYKDWQNIQSNEILPYKETIFTVETFNFVNQTLYKKKMQSEGLDECNRIVQTITTKMTRPA